MKNLLITVAIGNDFNRMLELNREPFEAYAKKCNAEFVAITDSTNVWWGIEKLRVGAYAAKYARTIYIDADISIRKDTPNLFDIVPEDSVGMHDDYPQLLAKRATEWINPTRKALLDSQDTSGTYPTVFNTGVIVASQHHADIWQPLKEPFPRHHCSEQFWIEHLAYRYPTFALPSEFNWQAWFTNFRFGKPYIKHYANCKNPNRIAFIKRDLDIYHAN